MQLPFERPLVVQLCLAMVRLAAFVVPEERRRDWADEWHAKIWHRWQFLFHAGEWDKREAICLLVSALPLFPDALHEFAMQDDVRLRVGRFVQSPLSCVGLLAAVLALVALVSGGLPATRDLLFKRFDNAGGRLLFVWRHPMVSAATDFPMPADVVTSWVRHSKLISGAAGFRASHRDLPAPDGRSIRTLIVTTDPAFFEVLDTKTIVGTIPMENGLVLSYDAWVKLFGADPGVQGTQLTVAGRPRVITGVLPKGFEPLSRQPTVYLLSRTFPQDDAFALVRLKPGISKRELDKNLINVAENFSYYFLQGQLRSSFAESALLTPWSSFCVAVGVTALLVLSVCRIKLRLWREAMQVENRRNTARQLAFFVTKTFLALACVFVACLEWSRSQNSLLFATFDPGSGPFLLWLYILGAMAVLFWTVADQRARCRNCLRLLSFPVRVGSPGSFLLEWSGTEFCCTQGHGVLHVPHMSPSWETDAERWIALDESWQGLFKDAK